MSQPDCPAPRLAERGLCTCVDPTLCPYTEEGRRRAFEVMRERGLLDENDQVRY